MQRTPADIDRLDPGEAMAADRLMMAFADEEIVLDDAAERRERQHDRLARPAPRLIRRRTHLHRQPVFRDPELDLKRPDAPGYRGEPIVLQEIGDGRFALMLDRGTAPHHGALV